MTTSEYRIPNSRAEQLQGEGGGGGGGGGGWRGELGGVGISYASIQELCINGNMLIQWFLCTTKTTACL